MSIPTIASYRLPGPEDLPAVRVGWHPEPARALLLIHDMQRYFLSFYDTAQSPVPELLRHIARLRAACAARGVPVVYTAQPSDPRQAIRGLLGDMWGPGVTAHPELADILPDLAPRVHDRVLQKTRYSAFVGTDLRELLRDAGRDQLWICGVYAHIGCMLTASEAFMHDVKPFLVADAVADFSRVDHDMALRFVAGRCGTVLDTQTLCHVLERGEVTQDGRALLREMLAALGIDAADIRDDDDLRDHGLDSVRLLELAERANARGLPVSVIDMMEHETFGAMGRYLDETEGVT